MPADEDASANLFAPYLARALVGWAYRWGVYFVILAIIYWWTENVFWLWIGAFLSIFHLAALLVWRVSQFKREIPLSRRD